MGRADLVVPIGTDQEKVTGVGVGDHIFEELEGCGVQPLEVIQEKDAGMPLAGKHGEEPAQYGMQAVFGLARGELRNRRLFANKGLDFRDEIDNELAMMPQSLAHVGPPRVEIGLAPSEHLANKALERLCQSGVRN